MCIGGDLVLSLMIAAIGAKIIPILRRLGYIGIQAK
jgi:hypothetical protein